MIPIVNHLWQSTVFAVAVLLLTLLLRSNRAQTRYWLWLAASVKFLFPFSLLVSLGRWLEWRPAEVAPVVSTFADQIGPSFTPLPMAATPPSASVLPTLLLAVWACGSAIVLGHWLARWLRIHAALRSATPAPMAAPIRVLASDAMIEPGVFGIFRPVLLLPAGILDRLTAKQLRAIVAHELCHVRRRDNLAAVMHMLVETLFWFHPLVWWIGKRLIEERERACDEEVVALGNSPEAYAEGIVAVCKHYLQSPLPCVSGVTGADLKKRIAAILAQRPDRRLTPLRKLVLAVAIVAVVAVPILIGAQERRLVFEVASVRPAQSDATHFSIRLLPGGSLNVSHTSLKELIGFAYDVQEFQVLGGPGWIGAARFDIIAKPDRPVLDELSAMNDAGRRSVLDQTRERLRALLEERFLLRTHRESKEGAVYALVVSRSGPKLKPASGQRNNSQRAGGGGGTFQATRWTTELLAGTLSRFVGRTVVDRTGIEGEYDMELTWSPTEEPGGTSIFTAIQEQLGLKLEAARGPVEFVAVDRAEKPPEN